MSKMMIENEINPTVVFPSIKKKSKVRHFFKQLSKSKTGLAGFIIIIFLLVLGVAGSWIAPFDPLKASFGDKLLPPMTKGHLLGTDQLGRDILSRIIAGTKISLIIGITTVFLSGLIGSIIGIISGYFRGWIDVILMRIVDVQLSFPFILLVLVVNAVLGAGLNSKA